LKEGRVEPEATCETISVEPRNNRTARHDGQRAETDQPDGKGICQLTRDTTDKRKEKKHEDTEKIPHYKTAPLSCVKAFE